MVFDRLVFVSGQGARDPRTDHLAGADIETQTEQCLKNVQAILRAGGSDLQYVLRCGVFLLDIDEFARMNAVYATYFAPGKRPARAPRRSPTVGGPPVGSATTAGGSTAPRAGQPAVRPPRHVPRRTLGLAQPRLHARGHRSPEEMILPADRRGEVDVTAVGRPLR